MLIGNKNDLQEQSQVSKDEGEKFAKRNGLIFFETSAKTSEGVEHTFTMAAKQIYQGIITQRYEV